MVKYEFRLTEEIARWAFEIKCKSSSDWHIAFTNPTAGPWKAIKSFNVSNVLGEVYRFDLEEVRPDIILVNDKLSLIIIVEAKDSLSKLLPLDQVEKSIKVIVNLSNILSNKGNSEFWGRRAQFDILTGVLWGAETESSEQERESLFTKYHDELLMNPGQRSDLIIGIETFKAGNNHLECKLYYKKYASIGTVSISPDLIANSLSLPIGR